MEEIFRNIANQKTDLEKLREGMKYSLIVVASVPMLVLYPFLQKFFTKGVMVGALKG